MSMTDLQFAVAEALSASAQGEEFGKKLAEVMERKGLAVGQPKVKALVWHEKNNSRYQAVDPFGGTYTVEFDRSGKWYVSHDAFVRDVEAVDGFDAMKIAQADITMRILACLEP